MDAKWLAQKVKKNGPEWKLAMRWANYVSKKRRVLPASDRHLWSKRHTQLGIQRLVDNINRGAVMAYTWDFDRGIRTFNLMREWWVEFCEQERVLVAEVVLLR